MAAILGRVISKSRGLSTEAITLTVAAALLRLVPHPPNFAPIGGVSLFSGAKVTGWQAYLVPVLAMFATDPILSYLAGYPAFSSGTPVIYISFLLNVVLGKIFLSHRHANTVSPIRIGAVALAGSLQFFAITNLAVWWHSGGMYPHTAAGLVACYTSAIPFLERTIVGDLFYSGVLFTVYHEIGKRTAQLVQAERL